jgi:membrane protease YdiL (CAAX protease family)
MARKEITYDAGIIQEFATRLYRQAASIIITSTFFGFLVGAAVAGGGAIAVQARESMSMAAIIGAIIGALWGYSRGRERAFKLKLDAS